jgi:uncharacterized protein (TIGR01619 family)
MSWFFDRADQVSEPSKEWDFYFCQVDNKPASIFVDIGRMNAIPDKGFQHMSYLRLYMKQPREDGLSSNEEYQILCDFEDRLNTKLIAKAGILYVGRNTNNGVRDFYFYVKEPKAFSKALATLMATLSEYEYETGDRLDANWSTYREFLYPDAKAYRTILNRRVLEALDQHGDDKAVLHKLDHRVYLTQNSQVQPFIDRILSMGFQIEAQNSEDINIFIVDFFRTDLLNCIDNVTDLIEGLVEEFGGDYDGWGTEVISTS